MRYPAAVFCAALFFSGIAQAQLLDNTKVDPGNSVNAPNGTIARSLPDMVGAGQGDEFTYGSSIYLIKRDPARSIRRGRQLFQRKFSADEGLGPRVNFGSMGDITQNPALGAGLADSCALCHGRPKGSAGFGGDVATRPDSRDAPHLFGLGLTEQLADEMTQELRAIRDAVIEESQNRRGRPWWRSRGRYVERDLVAKGVYFGRIAAKDGEVDLSGVVGVDPDLRVKPFFHHGGTISIREFIIGALRDEMGLQAVDPILCGATDPVNPQTRVSPAGFVFDPGKDTFERPPACSAADDPDGDGVSNEIDAALIDHMEFYLLNYFKPGQHDVDRYEREGRFLFHAVGCASCHVEDLRIDNDRRVADVETEYDPRRGIYNQLFATVSTLFHVVNDGEAYPQILPNKRSFKVRNFYSDLKRHDLGPMFHERNYDGTIRTHFVTEPLWGVGSTAPYGHDGRSINIDQVIRRHGGEAERARDEYVRLRGSDQRKIVAFLQSLVLFPPEDTASNLNPGNPGSSNPQDPSQHGSIDLGTLFQIAAEGPE